MITHAVSAVLCTEFVQCRVITGDPSWDASSGQTTQKMCKYSSCRSHVRSIFTDEEQKRLAQDVMYTSATHAHLAHDVTDSYRQTQNGSAHGRVFVTFKCWLKNKEKRKVDDKIHWKLLRVRLKKKKNSIPVTLLQLDCLASATNYQLLYSDAPPLPPGRRRKQIAENGKETGDTFPF